MENSLIYKLNDNNFDDFVNNGIKNSWLIMFYAPWCPHCKHFLPEFAKF